VTPSAWETANSVRAIQLNAGALSSYSTSYIWLGQNWFRNSSGAEIYVANGEATKYQQAFGKHEWFTAPSGTAGNAISFGDAKMTLNASGLLGIGETSPAAYVHIKGASDMLRLAGNATGVSLVQTFYNSGGTRRAYFGFGSNNDSTFFVHNDEAGAIVFDTNNTERARIDASGNVGIGTASPSQKLHVVGNTQFGNNGAYTDLVIGTDTALSGYNQTNYITPTTIPGGGTAFTALRLKSAVSTGTNRMDLIVDGVVGIGTTTPTTPLEVSGGTAGTGGWNRTATLTATYPTLIFNSNGTKWGGIAYDHSAAMRFWVNANNNDIFATTAAMSILNNGNIQTQGYVIFKDSVNSNTYGIRGLSGIITADGGGQWPTGWNFQYGGSSNSGLYISSSGNVGIGTTTPLTNAKFQVGTASSLTNYQGAPVGVIIPDGGGSWIELAENTTNGTSFRISHDGASETIMMNANARAIGFRAAGYSTAASDAQMFLSTSGNVGIGTTSPSTRLSVNGNANITGSLDVTGAFTAQTKSFKITHQTIPGKSLVYGVLEGAEHAVYVRGEIDNLDTIILPDEWTWLVDENSITVQLTPIGSYQKLYVTSMQNNTIKIANKHIINKSIKCYYLIHAVRKDVVPLQTVV
jgi:hypothetical protein